MSEANSGSAPPTWLRTAANLFAPALVLLAIVVPFLRFHQYNLILPESLILIGGATFIGLAIGALGRIRPQTLPPMLIAFTLSVYVFYRQEVTDGVIWLAHALGDPFGLDLAALIAIGVILFLTISSVCVLLRKHIETIVAAVFGTIVLSTVVLPTATGGEPVRTGSLPAQLNTALPPVIHIILDEHIGLAGLPSEFPASADARVLIPAVYKDFAVYSHAYSRFAETKYSLTSLMNGDWGADVPSILDSERFVFAPTQNEWFDSLRKKGYAIRVYQSAWFDMCRSGDVDACYTYSFFSPNAIQRSALTTMQRLHALSLKLFEGRGALEVEPMVALETLGHFRSDIAAAPHGVAYIVHLLIPHSGYLYDSNCSVVDPSEWPRAPYDDSGHYTPEERAQLYPRYLGQLLCAENQMSSLFAELKALGVYDQATIIVHGDHGSRIGETAYITSRPDAMTEQDRIDNYSALLAIKAPGIAPGIHDEPVALQRIFADAFLGGARKEHPADGAVFMRIDNDDHFGSLDFAWPQEPQKVAGAALPDDVAHDLRR